MEHEGLSLETIPFYRLILMCARAKEVDAALALIEILERCDIALHHDAASHERSYVGIYTALISACGKCHEQERVQQLLDDMQKKGLQPSVSTFNALLDTCQRHHEGETETEKECLARVARAEAIWAEMVHRGIEPDEISYGTMINTCAEHAGAHLAREYLDRMQDQGLQPTLHTYSSLIKAYAKETQLQAAEQTLQDMLRHGIKPSVNTFTCLIQACQHAHGGVERAWAILDEMKTVHRVEPNLFTLSVLLQVCCSHHDLPKAIDAVVMVKQLSGGEVHSQHIVMLARLVRTRRFENGTHIAGEMLERALQVPTCYIPSR